MKPVAFLPLSNVLRSARLAQSPGILISMSSTDPGFSTFYANVRHFSFSLHQSRPVNGADYWLPQIAIHIQKQGVCQPETRCTGLILPAELFVCDQDVLCTPSDCRLG